MKKLFVAAILLATAVGFQSHAYAQDSANGIIIHQDVYLGVAPDQLYQTLLSSEQFSACTNRSFKMFTASSAKIDPREGGAFSLFDGHIIGRIVELVPGKRIVEAWRVVDWPAGVYSIARFDLEPKGAGTQLSFDHIGFPAGLKEHLASGWREHYWEALNTYFRGR